MENCECHEVILAGASAERVDPSSCERSGVEPLAVGVMIVVMKCIWL